MKSPCAPLPTNETASTAHLLVALRVRHGKHHSAMVQGGLRHRRCKAHSCHERLQRLCSSTEIIRVRAYLEKTGRKERSSRDTASPQQLSVAAPAQQQIIREHVHVHLEPEDKPEEVPDPVATRDCSALSGVTQALTCTRCSELALGWDTASRSCCGQAKQSQDMMNPIP